MCSTLIPFLVCAQERATSLGDAVILASRSEVGRGEWERFTDEPFTIVPMGSVAYKLALVAAGAALVCVSGGWIALPDGAAPTWNNPDPLMPGLVATSRAVANDTARLLDIRIGS